MDDDDELDQFFADTLPGWDGADGRMLNEEADRMQAVAESIQTGESKEVYTRNGVKPPLRSYDTTKDRQVPAYARTARRLVEARAEAIARTKLDAEKTLREFSRIAFYDVRKVFDKNGRLIPIVNLDDDTAAAIKNVKVRTLGAEDNFAEVVEYSFHDKLRGLEAIAKRLGLFEEVHKIVVEGTVNLDDQGNRSADRNDRARRIAFLLNEAVKRKTSEILDNTYQEQQAAFNAYNLEN